MVKGRLQTTRFLAVIFVFVMVISTGTVMANGFDPVGDMPQDSKTFFSQFVVAGGPIVWFVLLPMSVVTVYLAIYNCLTIRRKRLLPAGVGSDIAATAARFSLERFVVKISAKDDLISRAVAYTVSQVRHHGGDVSDMGRFAGESLQEQALGLLHKVEWCNIIGNVAPMVGLFGTVYGMIRAFNLLGVSGGQPRPDQLAAAISVALITTFWGLLVAIPALAIHGIFRTRIEAFVGEAAIEIQAVLGRVMDSQKTEPDTKAPKPDSIKLIKQKAQDRKAAVPIKTVS